MSTTDVLFASPCCTPRLCCDDCCLVRAVLLMAPELLLLPAVFANAEHRPVHARCIEVDVLESVSNVLFRCRLSHLCGASGAKSPSRNRCFASCLSIVEPLPPVLFVSANCQSDPGLGEVHPKRQTIGKQWLTWTIRNVVRLSPMRYPVMLSRH